MGINFFILFLIVLSLIVSNLTFDEKIQKKVFKNIPLVTFNNSVLYDIDEKDVKQIVISSKALNYKNKDELYDAKIIIRNKQNGANTVSAEYILKKDMNYKLYENVNITVNNENNIKLVSDYLEYDEKNQIFKNNNDFILDYNLNNIVGNSLYLDNKNNILRAKNTHFKLKIEEN